MKIKKRILVAILNPRDGKSYTSMRAAAYYVQRGDAIYEPGRGIRFVENLESRELRKAEAEYRMSESIVADRGGLIFWDGCKGATDTRSARNSLPKMGVVGSNVWPSPDDVRFKREKQLVA